MIIDGHSHVTFPIEEHIKAMDKAGIDKTILFSTTFHPEQAINTHEVKEQMKYLNDLLSGKKGSMLEARKASSIELANAVKQFSDRYIGFGAVPTGLNLEDTKLYIQENISKNHFSGIGEFTLGVGQSHLLKNIFKANYELEKIPIWIHTFNPYTLTDIQETVSIAKQFPEIKVILGHLGGSNWIETMNLVAETSNLYLDTSAFYSTFILRTVINEIPEKCIFGVDYPFGDLELSKQAILKVANSPAIAEAVLGKNMKQLICI